MNCKKFSVHLPQHLAERGGTGVSQVYASVSSAAKDVAASAVEAPLLSFAPWLETGAAGNAPSLMTACTDAVLCALARALDSFMVAARLSLLVAHQATRMRLEQWIRHADDAACCLEVELLAAIKSGAASRSPHSATLSRSMRLLAATATVVDVMRHDEDVGALLDRVAQQQTRLTALFAELIA